jgi:hypothetical protein
MAESLRNTWQDFSNRKRNPPDGTENENIFSALDASLTHSLSPSQQAARVASPIAMLHVIQVASPNLDMRIWMTQRLHLPGMISFQRHDLDPEGQKT